MLTTDKSGSFLLVYGRFAGGSRVEPAFRRAGTATRLGSPGRGLKAREV